MKTIHITALIAISTTLCACSVIGDKAAMGRTYAPTTPSSVIVVYSAPSRQFEQIGIVSARGDASASDAALVRELQKQGAMLGADAVIVRTEQSNYAGGMVGSVGAFGVQPKVSGIAIKFLQAPPSGGVGIPGR